jgi:hypothetical protein
MPGQERLVIAEFTDHTEDDHHPVSRNAANRCLGVTPDGRIDSSATEYVPVVARRTSRPGPPIPFNKAVTVAERDAFREQKAPKVRRREWG